MITLVIMLAVVAFMAYLLLFRDQQGRMAVFFDLNTTIAMRGFWCLIVLLVHIPAMYQNPIQDLLGSFAYVGVTFFFMTSSYGLFLGMRQGQDALKSFWRRRLPKLLLPMLLSNILSVIVKFFIGNEWSPLEFMAITGWIRQLFIFYGIFWVIYKILPQSMSVSTKNNIFYIVIILFSFMTYVGNDVITSFWSVESYGFVYGALLCKYKSKFEEFCTKAWVSKCFVLCACAFVCGVAYIFLKDWVFFGDYLLRIILGLLILVFMLAWNVKKSIGNSIGRFLGRISYEIYLLQGMAFFILEALSVELPSGVFVAMSILLTVLLSGAVNYASRCIRVKCKLGE